VTPRPRTAVRQFCTSESNYPFDSYGKVQGKTRPGFVYFLQEGFNPEGPIKVGFSVDPVRRCRQLNRRLKDGALTVVAAFPALMEQEFELHRRWRKHRVIGEWFRPAPEILEAIDLCRILHTADRESSC